MYIYMYISMCIYIYIYIYIYVYICIKLGHSLGDSLIHPVFATAVLLVQPKVYLRPCN